MPLKDPKQNSNIIEVKSNSFEDIGFYYFQGRGVSEYSHVKDFNFTLIITDGCRNAKMQLEYES